MLLVALLSWIIPFCAVVASCAVYFTLARSYAALTAFGVAASDSEVLLVSLLSCTIPLFVVLASSSATADAISSARFAAVSERVAADSAAFLLCAAAVALSAASVAFVDAVVALSAAADARERPHLLKMTPRKLKQRQSLQIRLLSP